MQPVHPPTIEQVLPLLASPADQQFLAPSAPEGLRAAACSDPIGLQDQAEVIQRARILRAWRMSDGFERSSNLAEVAWPRKPLTEEEMRAELGRHAVRVVELESPEGRRLARRLPPEARSAHVTFLAGRTNHLVLGPSVNASSYLRRILSEELARLRAGWAQRERGVRTRPSPDTDLESAAGDLVARLGGLRLRLNRSAVRETWTRWLRGRPHPPGDASGGEPDLAALLEAIHGELVDGPSPASRFGLVRLTRVRDEAGARARRQEDRELLRFETGWAPEEPLPWMEGVFAPGEALPPSSPLVRALESRRLEWALEYEGCVPVRLVVASPETAVPRICDESLAFVVEPGDGEEQLSRMLERIEDTRPTSSRCGVHAPPSSVDDLASRGTSA